LYFSPVKPAQLIKYYNDNTPQIIAELEIGSVPINTADDMLDIIGEAGFKNCSRIIIHSGSFSKDFFDLRSGMAGEILQKFSNYRMKLAIVGGFTQLKSISWKDFIRESNRGSMISFANSVEEAIIKLAYN
jgi:hypothetical protein